MNLLRGVLKTLWKAFLVTFTLGLTCGLAARLGFPHGLFGLMMIPAGILFCHLADTPRPEWWKPIGLVALVSGGVFLVHGILADAPVAIRNSVLMIVPALLAVLASRRRQRPVYELKPFD